VLSPPPPKPRRIHLVLSALSLRWAKLAVQTLLSRSIQTLRVHLITDGAEDERRIRDTLSSELLFPTSWCIASKAECDALAGDYYRQFPAIRGFREGHPCWRKITDPPLFAAPGEEMVILDPDVYFPNRFTFEPTPDRGLLLMWQRPHCLLPAACVRAAYGAPARLAHHTDIGVAQTRAPLPWDWLEWFLRRLGGSDIPRVMHVESIVWAALAMRIGGGYLNPSKWICWHRSLLKRCLMLAGMAGPRLLRLERLQQAKCFHAGGVAKEWLVKAVERGWLKGTADQTEPTPILPFEELTPAQFEVREVAKRVFHRLTGAAL